jgi:hypothetical protein
VEKATDHQPINIAEIDPGNRHPRRSLPIFSVSWPKERLTIVDEMKRAETSTADELTYLASKRCPETFHCEILRLGKISGTTFAT